MRICIISQYFPPDPGGAATRARNLAGALAINGHSVVVIAAQPHYPNGPWGNKLRQSYQEGERITVFRTPVLPISHRGTLRHFVAYFFFAILATWYGIFIVRKVDVIWCVSPNYLCVVPGLAMKPFHDSRLVHEVVDLWPDALVTSRYIRSSILASLIEFVCRLSYRVADCITTLTAGMAEAITQAGASKKVVHILPNSIDQVVLNERERNEPRPSYYQDRFVVMYSGNIGAIYDFDVLLETATHLEHERDILLVLRGSGEMTEYVESRVKKIGCSNVLLLFGTATRADAIRQTAWADVCVLPLQKDFSQTASYPVKLLEYIALGKPVIVLAGGPVSTLVLEKQAGVVLRPGDCQGLTETIIRLRNNPKIVSRLSANAIDASDNFSAGRFATGTLEVLRSLYTSN